MTDEVLSHYRLYLAYSLSRLAFYTFSITTLLAFLGVAVLRGRSCSVRCRLSPPAGGGRGDLAVLVLTGRLFVRTLAAFARGHRRVLPVSMTRFYALWERLTPGRLRALDSGAIRGARRVAGAGLLTLGRSGAWPAFWLLSVIAALYVAMHRLGAGMREPAPAPRRSDRSAPNILHDRLRYPARRPALGGRLSSRAHAQPGAPGRPRLPLHRLLRVLCAHRAQPRLAAHRHLAPHARRARHVRDARGHATAGPGAAADSASEAGYRRPSSATGRPPMRRNSPSGSSTRTCRPTSGTSSTCCGRARRTSACSCPCSRRTASARPSCRRSTTLAAFRSPRRSGATPGA